MAFDAATSVVISLQIPSANLAQPGQPIRTYPHIPTASWRKLSRKQTSNDKKTTQVSRARALDDPAGVGFLHRRAAGGDEGFPQLRAVVESCVLVGLGLRCRRLRAGAGVGVRV